MAQFTITGMKDDEIEWIKDQMAEFGYPGSIVLRNLINVTRRGQAKKKAKK